MGRALTRFVPMLGVLVMFMTACTSDVPADRDVLISLTDEVIVPAYENIARDMVQLDKDVEALCNAPSYDSLEAARQSWRGARSSWMRSKAMWFGPVMERRSISLLDWAPIDTSGVDRLLAEDRPVGVDEVRNVLAANHRGFDAVEYALFDSDALVSFNVSDSRCSYLSALTEVAVEETDAILSEWMRGTERRPAYRDFFTERSNTALIAGAAVADVVRTQVFLIRDMVDMRLASALGLRDGVVDLSAIPGNTADNGLRDLRHEILGVQAMYEGSGQEALGISALVRPLSKDTDQRMLSQLTAAIAAIDSVEGTLRTAVVQHPHQVRNVYERLTELQRTMATEVVSLLGVSVGFTDTDGDSLR